MNYSHLSPALATIAVSFIAVYLTVIVVIKIRNSLWDIPIRERFFYPDLEIVLCDTEIDICETINRLVNEREQLVNSGDCSRKEWTLLEGNIRFWREQLSKSLIPRVIEGLDNV